MKKKALILIVLSSMTLAAGGLAVALSANQLGFIDSAAGEKVTGSILFSRATGSFTRIDETTSSTSATTGSGATYYAIAHSNSDVETTNYIATFGNGKGYDEMYIDFTTSPTGGTPFEFQKITGIKIKTVASTTLYAYYSSDGVNWNNSYEVACSSEPEKVTFASAQKYVRVGTSNVFGRYIVSVELFYECSAEPEPEPKEVDHLSFSSMKSNYVLGDSFEEPTVVAWYTDDTHEEVEASFSDVDMTKTGKQTVTATYQGVSKDFTIEVWPSSTAQHVTFKGLFLDDYEETETSAFLKDSSVLPYYGEPGETVTFTPVFKDAYMYSGCYDETGEIVFELDGKNITFTMPNSGVEIHIMYETNPFKQLSYVGFDMGSYESAPISTFIDESTFLPPRAKPGDTVSVTPVAKSGYAIDGVIDMSEAVTITENDGAYSFTMPSYNFEVTILFHEVVTLESIYVKNPKTSYSVGSNFVIPTVMGVYSNGAEQALTVTAENFSGFDSSAEVTGQVITVSYEGVADVTYTIDVVSGIVHTLYGTYTYSAKLNSGSNEFRLIFNSDGTGAFERDFTPDSTGVKESYGLNFVYDDSTTTSFSVTLTSFYEGTPHANADDIRTAFFTRYIFIYKNDETTNSTGVINADGSIKIKLTSATSTSAGSYYTFSK